MVQMLLSGRYEVLKRIGLGGFSEVYLAKDDNLGRVVAIKRANLLSLTETDRKRFLREARTLAKIQHPHIITIHDLVEEEDGHLYIVMQYADKGSLLEWIAANPNGLPIADVVEIGIAICKALVAVHENGVIHRDVKPGNILLVTEVATEKPVPKLADFGLARDLTATPLTASEPVIGTWQYAAPEVFRGSEEALDERRDVYSLGAVLYHAVTGRLPFGSDRFLHLDRAPKSPHRLRREVPAWLAQIILKALAVRQTRRYSGARAMLSALEQGRSRLQAALESRPMRRNGWTRYFQDFNSQRIRAIFDQAISNVLGNFLWWLIGIIVVVVGVRSCTALSDLATSPIPTPAIAPTMSPTENATNTPAVATTMIPSPTLSRTPKLTHTLTPTPTATSTATRTLTPTSSPTRIQPSRTRSLTPSSTSTLTPVFRPPKEPTEAQGATSTPTPPTPPGDTATPTPPTPLP